MENRKTADN